MCYRVISLTGHVCYHVITPADHVFNYITLADSVCYRIITLTYTSTIPVVIISKIFDIQRFVKLDDVYIINLISSIIIIRNCYCYYITS